MSVKKSAQITHIKDIEEFTQCSVKLDFLNENLALFVMYKKRGKEITN